MMRHTRIMALVPMRLSHSWFRPAVHRINAAEAPASFTSRRTVAIRPQSNGGRSF
jgi:hypothetical protein